LENLRLIFWFGLKSLAVPYFNGQGNFIGAVGVSGLSVRLDERTLSEYGKQILRMVN